MTTNDFNFMFDSSDFPISIEKFAAYLDSNLSDDEMQRVSAVIENDEAMQGVMDGLEQSEFTFAEYGQEDMQLPETILNNTFQIPIIKESSVVRCNQNGVHKIAAFAPIEEELRRSKTIERQPPQVLNDNNSEND